MVLLVLQYIVYWGEYSPPDVGIDRLSMYPKKGIKRPQNDVGRLNSRPSFGSSCAIFVTHAPRPITWGVGK
jgi:hypothetical protein